MLKYPEEEAEFKLPGPWLRLLKEESNDAATLEAIDDSDTSSISSSPSSTSIKDDEESQTNNVDAVDPAPYEATLTRTKSRLDTQANTEDRYEVDQQHEIEKTKSIPIVPRKTKDGAILVDWYYTDDPENPQNWTNLRRAMLTIIVCVYTFVVYTSSAIYTTSEEGVMQEFGVDSTQSSLGLALFVLGYGIGPLLFSPLSELPSVGRSPVYVWTMFLFVIVSIPTALVTNYPGLMVLRFLQGLFGSPCLANGAASLGDMYSMMSLPYALM
jgi:DHA1 family multidrug resistance protein-like MFS transporter